VAKDIVRLLADVADLPADPGTVAGVGFPGVVKRGVVHTAAHLDPGWIGTDAAALLTGRLGHPTYLVNDADAAGLAEVRFGAGAGVEGVVIMVTLGTGIGVGLFVDGTLVPNTELGHLTINGRDAETRASALVRETKDQSWKKWGRAVDDYLAELERLMWPDLIIIGGGVSTDFDRFGPRLARRARVVPAQLGNDAGIIGAALRAHEQRQAGR
jgi:polyphosphate glucokinase